MFFSNSVFAQNTKGDRPVNNQRQVRETKVKSIKRREKGKTKDLSGRRLRTKNKSSASRANSSFPQFSPNHQQNNKPEERAAKPRTRIFNKSPRESRQKAWKGDLSGHSIKRIKPSKSGIARTNVYPQNGPYVNNPSSKPKNKSSFKPSGRSATGKRISRRMPKQKERAWKGNIRKGPIGTQSASGSVSNVYPQKNPFSRFVSKSPKPKKGKIFSNSRVRNRKTASGSVSNIYPQKNPFSRFVTKSPTPKRSKTYSNSRVIKKNLSTGANPDRRKLSIVPRTVSQLFIQRGKKNVYWGKFSKGERAFTHDLSGRPLRTKNFRSTPAGLVGRDTLRHFGRKPGGDRSYEAKRKRGRISGTPRENRAWIGDIAGRNIRSPRRKKAGEVAGEFALSRDPVTGKKKRSTRLPASGVQRQNDNFPLAGKAPGKGAVLLGRAMHKLRGQKTFKGGGSVSIHGNNNNTPIQGKMPGIGGKKVQSALAKLHGRKPVKGGGSVSAAGWNNHGRSIDGKGAGKGTVRASRFQGSFKTGRPAKGGGSISGKLWNNGQTAINVRTPGSGAARAGKYAGNIKAGRVAKGGGSVSGKLWNNQQTAINVRRPGQGAVRASKYTGNLHGGELRSRFQNQGEEFSGSLKTRRRPLKGGGSVSGRLWNNSESAIAGRRPGSGGERVGKYSGNLRGGDLRSRFKKQGEEYSGNLRASSLKPKLSGRLKRYSGNTKIQNLSPAPRDQGEEFTGVIKIRNRYYTQNPNAFEESTKKQRPNKNIRKVPGLQVKVKRDSYEKKPNASHLAMRGQGPSKSTVKASEYSRSMKMFWNYKHNPSSSEYALKTRDHSRQWDRSTTFAGHTRLTRSFGRNPLSSDDALKVLVPGKAYARVGDYQGNIKMHKYNDRGLHPDAQFAHKYQNNVKGERTLLMDVKLLWAKLFKKSDTQPANVKEKVRRPRYDRGEKGLWADDENFRKK
jgi:hypothetical protein